MQAECCRFITGDVAFLIIVQLLYQSPLRLPPSGAVTRTIRTHSIQGQPSHEHTSRAGARSLPHSGSLPVRRPVDMPRLSSVAAPPHHHPLFARLMPWEAIVGVVCGPSRDSVGAVSGRVGGSRAVLGCLAFSLSRLRLRGCRYIDALCRA